MRHASAQLSSPGLSASFRQLQTPSETSFFSKEKVQTGPIPRLPPRGGNALEQCATASPSSRHVTRLCRPVRPWYLGFDISRKYWNYMLFPWACDRQRFRRLDLGSGSDAFLGLVTGSVFDGSTWAQAQTLSL